MRTFSLLSILCLLAGSPISQEATVRTVVAEGRGSTEEEAMENARLRALRIAMDPVAAETEPAADVEATLLRDLRERPEGIFASVDVLRNGIDPETALWNCRIEADILRSYLERSGSARLPTLGILPFRIEADSFLDEVHQWPADKFARILHQSLVEKMVHGGRFRILEREDPASFEQELDRIRKDRESGEGALSSLALLGRKLGADRLLTGTLSDCVLRVHHRQSVLTGESSVQLEVRARIGYRVLDTATGGILWAGTATYDHRTPPPSNAADPALRVIEGVGLEFAREILEVMHPLQVLAVREDGRILLNRGGSLVRSGEMLEVRGPREILEDPGTGAPIHIDGDFLGILRVERVLPRYSSARFVSGEGQDRITRSCVLRRPARPQAPPSRPVPAARSRSRFDPR